MIEEREKFKEQVGTSFLTEAADIHPSFLTYYVVPRYPLWSSETNKGRCLDPPTINWLLVAVVAGARINAVIFLSFSSSYAVVFEITGQG